jgi:peptidoglycan/LPS O-acetylase OafA/YrhL
LRKTSRRANSRKDKPFADFAADQLIFLFTDSVLDAKNLAIAASLRTARRRHPNCVVITKKDLISQSADTARFLGASAIFYYHIGISTGYPLSRWGEYAVTLFIILSGVAYSCFSSIQPADLPSYRRYIGRRLAAIFPTFVIINCAIYLAGYLYPSALGRPFTVGEFALSATGMSQYFGQRYLSTPMWFVLLIIQAYFLFPIIDNCLKRVSPIFVIIGAFGISLFFIGATFLYFPSHAVEICRNWSVIFRLPEVCIAIILGRCVICRRDLQAGLIALALFVFLSFLLAMVSTCFDRQRYILSLPWHGLLVTIVIVALAIVAAAILAPRGYARFLQLIGAASFPFFLAHGIAILFIYRRFGSAVTPWVAYFVLCWCAAIVFTALVNRMNRSRRINV